MSDSVSKTKNDSSAIDPDTTESTAEESPKRGPKKKQPITIHPALEKAIRYTTFMLTEEGKPQTAAEFIQEAIGRQLTYSQKHGVEFPPKMLAELTRLGLLK